LIEGVTLRAHIAEKALEGGPALAIAMQIADAVAAAHAKGIIHRDLKPANVMIVGRAGHVKVLDFGLAKQTVVGADQPTLTHEALSATGVVMGTPHYLSPEVLQGSPADARTDLWAFGVVMYQMLSGRLPFNGATMYEISSSILKEDALPLPPSVPAGLRAIVERCLKKQPEERYEDAAEVWATLARLQTGDSTQTGTSRRTWLWATCGASVLVAGGVFWWRRPQARHGHRLSSNREANELFALGVNFVRVQNDLEKAQDCFARARALDPHFSEALRYHALSYVIRTVNGYTNDAGLLFTAEGELRQVAREAPDLESLPSAQAGLYVLMGRKELVPYERLERVTHQNPTFNDNCVWRIVLYTLAEENEPAKTMARDVLTREPLFMAPRVFLGEILRTEGDVAGAVRELQMILEQRRGSALAVRALALALMDSGELGKSRILLEEMRPMFVTNYIWRHTWALLLALEDKRGEALQAMDADVLKFAAAVVIVTSQTADFYAVLGDTDKALDWLGQAVNKGDHRSAYFKRNPRFATLRHDSRFQRIIDSVEAQRK
jgi:hypothetical protein